MSGFDAVAKLQRTSLPCQLSSECVVGVVGVLQDVWWGCENTDPLGHGGGSQRRGLVPGFVADATMQHSSMPHQLCGVSVVSVDGVQQAMWHGCPDAHPFSDNAAGLWWHCLPVVGGIAVVQYTGLPGSLCGVCVDGLVHVLQAVWHGCAIANPLGHHAASFWRCIVSRVGAIAAV